MADQENDIDDSEEPGIVPSRLDQTAHAEAILLFEDSAQSIFFSKAQQWKTVGTTLVTFLAIISLGKFVSSTEAFVLNLKLVVILAATAAIFILGIYQFWQHTESKKIAAVTKEFSSLWRDVRGIKSSMEANFHRYFLLASMISIIIIGGWFTIESLNQLS